MKLDMLWLRERLAADFVHTSPFGRLEGREAYLAAVEPLARKSVRELRIIDVVGDGDSAAIWFENRTTNGVVPSCDWLRAKHGTIVEIRSFYDASAIREVLSSEDQGSLDAPQ